jgi:lipopolysaccharide/colanic/teichoic acid biosynthesis glycosyltransferase
MKRILDVMLSLVLLVVLFPLLASIAILVRLASPGPSLFRHTRVGLEGSDFVVLKFRTMNERPDTGAGSFDAGDDSRVTGIGRILRATKLDELPQLWNVLRGEMSFVGPRPEVREWVEVYPERWKYVHRVKPGITDPASILYRNEEELLAAVADPEEYYRCEILPRKLDLYEKYVREQSLWLDIKIIFRTAMTVVSGRARLR